jgi:carbon monoxide dehydrogenase subunit G
MGCFNSAVVDAPIDTVWKAIRDFHDLSWAPNVVTKMTRVGDEAGNQIGAKRILNDAFHETLVAFDMEAREFKYSIDDGPGPVASDSVVGYVGHVRCIEVTANNSTLVTWASDWAAESGGTKDFCDPIYQAILSDLQKTFA